MLNKYLVEALERSLRLSPEQRVAARYDKFRSMGEIGLETTDSP